MNGKVAFAFLLITIAALFLGTFVDAGIVGWAKCKVRCRSSDLKNPICVERKGHYKDIGWKTYKCYHKNCKSAVKYARHGSCSTKPTTKPSTASQNPAAVGSTAGTTPTPKVA